MDDEEEEEETGADEDEEEDGVCCGGDDGKEGSLGKVSSDTAVISLFPFFSCASEEAAKFWRLV